MKIKWAYSFKAFSKELGIIQDSINISCYYYCYHYYYYYSHYALTFLEGHENNAFLLENQKHNIESGTK